MEEKEIWLPVPDSNGVRVSNIGRVKRGRKIVQPYPDKDGYLRIRMGPKLGFVYIHRIVATLFVENPENKEIVDHIDSCKTNNRWDNLRWCTVQENTRYASEADLLGTNRKGYVVIVDSNGFGRVYKTSAQAAKVLNVTSQIFSQGLNGKKKTVKGHRCFRISELQVNEACDEDGFHYGNTIKNGNFAEAQKGNITVRISDNSEKPESFANLKTKAAKLLMYLERECSG